MKRKIPKLHDIDSFKETIETNITFTLKNTRKEVTMLWIIYYVRKRCC